MYAPLFQRGEGLKGNGEKVKQHSCVEEFYPETNQPLIRPEIHFFKALVLFFVVLGIDIGITCVVRYLLSQFSWCGSIGTGVLFFLAFLLVGSFSLLIFSKRIVIFAIRLYQRYAPYDIRSQCLFVPNCSEYMVLAIEKYGLVKGIRKGMDRYHRCHAPNGGEDYP